MSALARIVGLALASAPPATRTRPSGKRVARPAVWPIAISPAELHELVEGSNSSAEATDDWDGSSANPPVTSTRPSSSIVASGKARGTDIDKPGVHVSVSGS